LLTVTARTHRVREGPPGNDGSPARGGLSMPVLCDLARAGAHWWAAQWDDLDDWDRKRDL
jgi:hypothetical protein